MHAVVLNLPTASGQIYSGPGCMLFHETYETTGSSTAQYSFWDNTTNAGTRLLTVTLNAGQSTRDYIRKHYMPFYTGLYFHLDSGALNGSCSVLLEHECWRCWQLEDLGVEGVMGGFTHRVPSTTAENLVRAAGVTPDGSPIPSGTAAVPTAFQTQPAPPAGRRAYVFPGPGTDYFVPEPPNRT